MKEKIFCLVTSGGSLTDAGLSFLFKTAHMMWRYREQMHKIKTLYMEGLLTTRNKPASLGTDLGIEFTAEIECGERRFNTTFVVRVGDLDPRLEKQGVWLPCPPDEPVFIPPALN